MSWIVGTLKFLKSTPLLNSATTVRSFQTTSALCAVPPKKKRKVDPQQILMRMNKKTRRIEKEIKRLMRRGRSMKPIEELEGDIRMKRQLDKYQRTKSESDIQEESRRALLLKKWCRFTRQEDINEVKKFRKVVMSRDEALAELKLLCPVLYEKAVAPDVSYFGVSLPGPVETPPIKTYMSPDGVYTDITTEYKYAFEVDRKFIVNEKDKKKRNRPKNTAEE